MRCGQCDKTTGVIFNPLPAKVKCSIDNQLHEMSEQCKIEFVPLKHGHWDYIEEYFADRWWNTYQCSVCGHQEDFEEPYRMKYCPECGAKMDEVTK